MAHTHAIDAEGLRLHVEEHGSGPAILLGHSLLCDQTMFAPQIEELSRTHRVIGVDFRGHGKSQAARRPYTIGDQAEDYRRVLDALGIERAVIAGLSMGGMAALHLALRHPARVAGLLLMNTSAGSQEPRWSALQFQAMAQVARAVGFGPFLQRQVAPLMFGATFLEQHPRIVEHWMEKMAQLDRRGLAFAVRMVATRPSVEGRLGEIRAPALVLGGSEDKATPPSLARRIARGLPGAELRILDKTGHLSTIERPEEVTRHLRSALQSWGW